MMNLSIFLVAAMLVCMRHASSFFQSVRRLKHVNHENLHTTFLQATTIPENQIPSLKGVKYRINQIIDPTTINSVRVRHIQLVTEEMAVSVRNMLVKENRDFVELASAVSSCEGTRNNGGDLGWSVDLKGSPQFEESLYTPEILNAAVSMNKGDVKVVCSVERRKEIDNDNDSTVDMRRWDVIQLIDVSMDLSPDMQKRKRNTFASLRGDSALSSGQQLTYSIDTMGCQMNTADSERIEGQLDQLGYTKADDPSESNVVILNTCSIRDHAEQKVYSHMGPHAKRKREGEDVTIVVAGCVAQQEGQSIIKRFPEVDIVMGPQYANKFTHLLENVFEGNQVVATDPIHQMEDTVSSKRSSDVVAYVNVIYGCNERCTYCVVPNTRGVEQSRTKEAIVEEVQMLVANGYKEVTLLGQNVDSWGRDFRPMQTFASLLTAVGQVEGIERVRFLTSHPKYISERVILAIKENPTLMPCFYFPFQSGDNEVLKNMRRGYTRERYLDIVDKIRLHLPDATIIADCIVGFPGETNEQFERTLDLMRIVKFDQIMTAAYSPRPSTPAADWGNQLPEEVKQFRLEMINRLASEHALERSKRFLGRTMKVLVEDVNVKRPSQVVGRNEHSRLVFFDGDYVELKGNIVEVKITEARPYSLTGKLVH